MTPTIVTERLVLRAPRLEDFAGYARTLVSDRAQFIGGPYTKARAWREFAPEVGSWALLGFGYWTVEERRSAAFVGSVGLSHPVDYLERELGWVIDADFEGRGYAFEAAAAARDHAFIELGWSTLVSYIDPANARSIALAERLGAERDGAAQKPAAETLVYRHAPAADREEVSP